MENCLVTKLKGDVQNESVKRLGELKLVVSLPANQRVVLTINDVNNLLVNLRTATNGVKFSSSASGELTDTYSFTGSSSNADVYVANTTQNVLKATIFISNKYKITPRFNYSSVYSGARVYTETYKNESSDWITAVRFTSAGVGNEPMLGGIQNLKGMFDATFIRISTDEESTTEDWSIFTKLTDLSFDSHVSGDIVNLGALTSLTNFAFGNSHCSGTIESWVQAQRANGRTTGSVTGNSTNSTSNVTFNGDKANAKGGVSWTENTITMNGITINA